MHWCSGWMQEPEDSLKDNDARSQEWGLPTFLTPGGADHFPGYCQYLGLLVR